MVALRQLLPNSQSFIENCVQELSGEVVAPSCTTTATTSVVVTSTVSPVLGSGAAAPRTLSVQTLNPPPGPGGANTGVVTVRPVASAAVTGGAAPATVLLQTSKPLTTSVSNPGTAVSLQPEKPVVSGAAVTLALPAVTFGETSAAPLCLPSVKPAITSAGTKPEKTVIGPPVQMKLAQPGPLLPQSAGIPQAVKVKQLVSNSSFLPQLPTQKTSHSQGTGKTLYTFQI